MLEHVFVSRHFYKDVGRAPMEIVTDQMKVVSIDKEGKVYDKVSRAELVSKRIKAVLDYHSILLPLKISDTLDIVVYKGEVEDGNVPKDYEYVMLGRCYKCVESEEKNVYYISFGGLLMHMESDLNIKLCDFDSVSFACKRL